jgi:endonuclease/exonuclease/phosphatase family metal-dependent hydrolase
MYFEKRILCFVSLLCLKYLFAAGLMAPAILCGADRNTASGELIRFQGPEKLRFDDLVTLAAIDPPPAELQARLERVLEQPFISNEATLSGATPKAPLVRGIGPVLRIAEWNINRTTRGAELKLALSDKQGFVAAAQANPKLNSKEFYKITEQVEHLQAADVIVLDEIDDGVKRMNYENVPRELAKALHMNYVFGVEFIELNGIYVHQRKLGAVQAAADDNRNFGEDPSRDLGMEGSAMLSRYPIRDARIIRLPSEYDWYHGEIKALSDLQKVQKWSAKRLFDESIRRQVRRGGRLTLVVNLEVPQSPTGLVTVVCPHLEDYTDPRGRRVQADYLLSQMPQLSNPVIVAGDFNTMGRDAHPQGLLTSLASLHFWLTQALFFVGPVPGLNYLLYPINSLKNADDPTAANVPVLAPNKEKRLFDDMNRFRFADGGKFSWDGEKDRSFQHRGRSLADSNQRGRKGFVPTFFFKKTYHGLVGEAKIDWFFVKPGGSAPQESGEPLQFAPFFGRTLPLINTALAPRISDHCPITLDIPLTTRVAGNVSATAEAQRR